MRHSLSFSEIKFLKTELKRVCPEVTASHRIEAAARGFGYLSYAAMRSSLTAGEISIDIDDVAFENYLHIHNAQCAFKLRRLTSAICRLKAATVLRIYPTLTVVGFDNPYRANRSERHLNSSELEQNFANRRRECLEAENCAGFELACIYLNTQSKIASFNRSFSSYQLKHRAEDLVRVQGKHTEITDYVSNGMFIIAALSLGFRCKQFDPFGANAFINISSKSVRATAAGPLMTRDQKRALFNYALAS